MHTITFNLIRQAPHPFNTITLHRVVFCILSGQINLLDADNLLQTRRPSGWGISSSFQASAAHGILASEITGAREEYNGHRY
jgi:hypothetical protein